ncbi:MAG: glucose 1-dehydrogenase [Dehalococcoidia bacterium]
MADRLEGKVALVTGGGGGIGGACARGMAAEGAAIVCTDLDADAAEGTARAIRDGGGRAIARQLDVTDRKAVPAAVEAAVEEFGGVDVLFNCAGTGAAAHFLDVDPDDWERIIAVNLTGSFLVAQATARRMVAQGRGGAIINVSSQLAEVAQPDRAPYVASKGGVRMLTKAMALDLARHGIRVNALAPGPTLTNRLIPRLNADEEYRTWMLARVPLGRFGRPEDMAGAVVFLASDDARWVTGATLLVDGGYLAR